MYCYRSGNRKLSPKPREEAGENASLTEEKRSTKRQTTYGFPVTLGGAIYRCKYVFFNTCLPRRTRNVTKMQVDDTVHDLQNICTREEITDYLQRRRLSALE